MQQRETSNSQNVMIDEAFKALSDPTRRTLLETLGEGKFFCSVDGETVNGICVQDLSTLLNLPQSTISRHLRILRQAKLVNNDRSGTWHYYYCNLDTIGQVQSWLAGLQTRLDAEVPPGSSSANHKPQKQQRSKTSRKSGKKQKSEMSRKSGSNQKELNSNHSFDGL